MIHEWQKFIRKPFYKCQGNQKEKVKKVVTYFRHETLIAIITYSVPFFFNFAM